MANAERAAEEKIGERDGAILSPHNRGSLLDLVIFCVNLILFETLRRLATTLVGAARNDKSAQLAVGLFLAGLFFLQPLAPTLKRWSFHKRFAFDAEDSPHTLTNLTLGIYGFFYLFMLVILSWTAAFVLMEVAGFSAPFGFRGQIIGGSALLADVGLSVIFKKIAFNFFAAPKEEPRWKFLLSPQAETLGDVLLFLNVICFQILWGVYTSSQQFWEGFYSKTHLKPGDSFTTLMERLWILNQTTQDWDTHAALNITSFGNCSKAFVTASSS